MKYFLKHLKRNSLYREIYVVTRKHKIRNRGKMSNTGSILFRKNSLQERRCKFQNAGTSFFFLLFFKKDENTIKKIFTRKNKELHSFIYFFRKITLDQQYNILYKDLSSNKIIHLILISFQWLIIKIFPYLCHFFYSHLG